jgi:hypothetical protein
VASTGEMRSLRRAALLGVKRQIERAPKGMTNFWSEMGPSASHFGGWAFGNVAGRVTGIDKGTDGMLYVATAAGGVWKSANDGLSWTSLLDDFGTQPVGAIAVDPNDPAVLWVGTGDYNSFVCENYFGLGMLRSTDGGASWEERNGGTGLLATVSAFSAILIDPRNSSHVLAAGYMRDCSGGVQSPGGMDLHDERRGADLDRAAGRDRVRSPAGPAEP